MKIDLSGKSALVTGSTGGIGFAIARGLQEAGAAVVMAVKDGMAAENMVAENMVITVIMGIMSIMTIITTTIIIT